MSDSLWRARYCVQGLLNCHPFARCFSTSNSIAVLSLVDFSAPLLLQLDYVDQYPDCYVLSVHTTVNRDSESLCYIQKRYSL